MSNRYLIGLFFISFSSVAQVDCNYPSDYIPKDLQDALTYLDCTWSAEYKDKFRSTDERQAVGELHMGTGLAIRNGWDLWEGRNSLYRSFKAKGISHPDDISSIILTSFHRHLNNREIDLKGQVRRYRDYWKVGNRASDELAKEQRVVNKEKFHSYMIGDTVSMRFAQGNCDCLLLYKVENEVLPWDEDQKTCIVRGVIKGKRIQKKFNFVLLIEPFDICGQKMAHHGDGDEDNLSVEKVFRYNIRIHLTKYIFPCNPG